MTDDEYERHRNRAVMAAFQTGRPVFADNEGEMRFVDGAGEPVPADVAAIEPSIPKATALAIKAARASRAAYVLGAIAAVMNATMGLFWNTWQIVPAIVLGGCSIVWFRINRHQRAVMAHNGAQK